MVWFTHQKRRGKIQTVENHVHQGLSKVFVFYTYSSWLLHKSTQIVQVLLMSTHFSISGIHTSGDRTSGVSPVVRLVSPEFWCSEKIAYRERDNQYIILTTLTLKTSHRPWVLKSKNVFAPQPIPKREFRFRTLYKNLVLVIL